MQTALIDIGANLGHDSFSHDYDDVLRRAQDAGLSHMVITCTSVEASQKAADLARALPDLLSSTAGIHPHEASTFDSAQISELRALASLPEVRAIGETGLDFFRDFSPRHKQEEAFAAQLDLATEVELPAFLHQRDAHDAFISILREFRDDLPQAVVHCFTGTREELHDYLDLDIYVGITGWICDERRGHHLHEFVADIPDHRLMIETDAPYLLPRTIKPRPASRRNEPAYLPFVLETLAQCRKTSPEQLAEASSENAKLFFNL